MSFLSAVSPFPFSHSKVTTGGHLRHFRFLLSDPEAVAQGRTCILQEASLASPYPKCTASIPSARDQNPLRLLLPHRPSAPALPHRPLAHAALQADDVPHARARRAGDAAQRLPSLRAPDGAREAAARSALARVRCPARCALPKAWSWLRQAEAIGLKMLTGVLGDGRTGAIQPVPRKNIWYEGCAPPGKPGRARSP